MGSRIVRRYRRCFGRSMECCRVSIAGQDFERIREWGGYRGLVWNCYLVHDSPKQEKDYAFLLSFVGQARLQFAGLHSLFLALWCTVIEIGGAMMDLLFWDLMYLYSGFICCRRCFFDNWCICASLIFAVADALFVIVVSALPWYSLLQILFILPIMCNCICILLFLKLEDASFVNFASTSPIFLWHADTLQ